MLSAINVCRDKQTRSFHSRVHSSEEISSWVYERETLRRSVAARILRRRCAGRQAPGAKWSHHGRWSHGLRPIVYVLGCPVAMCSRSASFNLAILFSTCLLTVDSAGNIGDTADGSSSLSNDPRCSPSLSVILDLENGIDDATSRPLKNNGTFSYNGIDYSADMRWTDGNVTYGCICRLRHCIRKCCRNDEVLRKNSDKERICQKIPQNDTRAEAKIPDLRLSTKWPKRFNILTNWRSISSWFLGRTMSVPVTLCSMSILMKTIRSFFRQMVALCFLLTGRFFRFGIIASIGKRPLIESASWFAGRQRCKVHRMKNTKLTIMWAS